MITCHAEGPPQPRGELARVAVSKFHATHTHDLAHEADLVPLQVFAAQVLERRHFHIDLGPTRYAPTIRGICLDQAGALV